MKKKEIDERGKRDKPSKCPGKMGRRGRSSAEVNGSTHKSMLAHSEQRGKKDLLSG